jgi:hypothetical protein
LVGKIAVSTDKFADLEHSSATIGGYLRTLAVINFYEEDYLPSCLLGGGLICYAISGS